MLERANERTTTVQGNTYTVYADFIRRAMFAEDADGNKKMIKGGGYLNNDLSVRKAIANVFGLDSFRK